MNRFFYFATSAPAHQRTSAIVNFVLLIVLFISPLQAQITYDIPLDNTVCTMNPAGFGCGMTCVVGTPQANVSYEWCLDGNPINSSNTLVWGINGTSFTLDEMNLLLTPQPIGVPHNIRLKKPTASASKNILAQTCQDNDVECGHVAWNYYVTNNINGPGPRIVQFQSIDEGGLSSFYSWDFGASGVAPIMGFYNDIPTGQNGTMQAPLVTFPNAGTFVVTMQYSTLQNGAWVTEECQQTISIDGQQSACFQGEVDVECSKLFGVFQAPIDPNGATYTWEINGVVVQSGSGAANATLNWNPLAYNAYTNPNLAVTLTYTPASPNFCGTKCVINYPIPRGIYIDGTNTTQNIINLVNTNILPQTLINGANFPSGLVDIFVEGVLTSTSNQNYTFQNAQFHMGSGSTIRVQANSTLVMANSGLSASCGVLWQGITMQTNTNNASSTLAFGSVQIRDAVDAVRLCPNAVFTSRGSTFRANHVGITYPQISPTLNTAPLFVELEQNTFNCENEVLLPNYPNNLATITSNRSFAGIRLSNCSMFSPPIHALPILPNVIRNMEHGIYGQNSFMELGDFQYENITDDPSANWPNLSLPAGTAVVSIRSPQQSAMPELYCGVRGFGNTNVSNTAFNNCGAAVRTSGSVDLAVWNNRMENMDNGVVVATLGNLGVAWVYDNLINTRFFGIDVNIGSTLSLVNDGTILIEGNVINRGIGALSNNVTVDGALRVSGLNIYDHQNSFIRQNQVNFRGAGVGIRLNGLRNMPVIDNNIVTLLPTAGSNFVNQTGLFASNINNCEFFENTATSTNPGPFFDVIDGFRFDNIRNSLVSCNSSSNSVNGINFVTSTGTTNINLRRNTMSNHNTGLRVFSNIGAQDFQGNTWCVPMGLYASGTINAPISSPFQNSNVTISLCTEAPNPLTQVSPTNWFTTFNLTSSPCIFTDPFAGDPENSAMMMGIGSLQQQSAVEGNMDRKWAMESYVYEALEENPSAIVGTEALTDFYVEASNGSIGEFVTFRQELGDLPEPTLGQKLSINNLLNENESLIEDLTLNGIELSEMEFTDPTWITKIEERKALINEVEENLEIISTVVENILSPFVSNIDELEAENIDLPELLDAHTIEKYLSDIRLKAFAPDFEMYNEEDAMILNAIAGLCPQVYGDLVYDARTMYWTINPAAYYAFDEDCVNNSQNLVQSNLSSFSSKLSKQKPEADILLSPNPSSSYVDVLFKTEQDAGFLVLTNVLGIVLMKQPLDSKNGTISFETSTLPNGSYSVQYKVGNRVLCSKTLLVQH